MSDKLAASVAVVVVLIVVASVSQVFPEDRFAWLLQYGMFPALVGIVIITGLLRRR